MIFILNSCVPINNINSVDCLEGQFINNPTSMIADNAGRIEEVKVLMQITLGQYNKRIICNVKVTILTKINDMQQPADVCQAFHESLFSSPHIKHCKCLFLHSNAAIVQ